MHYQDDIRLWLPRNDHRTPDKNTSRKGEYKGHSQNSLAEKLTGVFKLHNPRIIEEYLDDTPYPSYLVCGTIHGRPLHVVGAYDKEEGVIIVVTAYEPDPDRWEDHYTRRKS